MEYIVVNEISISKLVEEVNKKITDGFEPIGGISNVQKNYQQAMTKQNPISETVISLWGG